MAAREVALHRASAAIRNMSEIDVRHSGEQLGRHMGAGADAGRRIGDLAGLFAGARNQVGNAAHRKRRMGDEDLLIGGDQPDRREIPLRIVTGIGVERRGIANTPE
jgi:hypothetical protein